MERCVSPLCVPQDPLSREKGCFRQGLRHKSQVFMLSPGLLDPVWGLRVGVVAQYHSSLGLDWNGAEGGLLRLLITRSWV